MPTRSAERVREQIERRGPIPFAEFMEEALYGDGGYYARQELAIGESGDYVTGSSHSPLFGERTAELLRRLDGELGKPADYLEAGYGAAAHLRTVMASSPGARRWLACDRIQREVPAGVESSTEPTRWPEGSIDGLIFSYELFDALPVHRLVRREDGLLEMGVALAPDGTFAWHEMPLSDPALERLVPVELEVGQIADVADWGAAYAGLASRLGHGLVVTVDYGYSRDRLFDARVRRHGTLACYRRQRVHRDPFVEVGTQDLTAHVDLTALVSAGEQLGLETVALTRQAAWLAALGILDDMADRPAVQRVAAMQLLDLDGMGEELRVLVQARGVQAGEILDLSLL